METFIFFLFGIAAVVAALAVVTLRNPVHSALALVGAFFSLAALYVTLGAPFIAAMQVIIYAGAVMVLFLFVVMLLRLNEPQRWDALSPLRVGLGFAAAGAVLVVALAVVRQTLITPEPMNPELSKVAAVGEALFRRFLLPFEIVSVLLLGAIIGAVALVKRSEGEPSGSPHLGASAEPSGEERP